MNVARGVAVVVVMILYAGSAVAQDGWVGEVFLGWGDGNSQVRSMAEFDGDLYAGTYKSDGTNIYVRAVTPPWVPSAMDGFGNASNQHAPAMAVFSYYLGTWFTRLYVGVSNSSVGGQVWTYNGSDPWFQANTSGFGSSDNYNVSALATFSGSLWAGTANGNGAEIYSFTGVTWVERMTGGFGNSNNFQISQLVVHDGKLFAATLNNNDGGEIWWTSNGSDWYNTVPAGFFSSQLGVTAMASTGATLYAAVETPGGVQVWQIDPGPIAQINSNGFGSAANECSHAMIAYQGELYVGTVNDSTGGQVWRLRGSSWSQVNQSGFGDTDNRSIRCLGVYNNDLFAGTWNSVEGSEVWRYPLIFADGFETGDTTAWSVSIP
jgi:flagellin